MCLFFMPLKLMLNIVLINPEIPFNTGNIGRSCVATGTRLHLVGKLGFKIASKEIRRSGLDYWPNLDYKRYETWEEFLQINQPAREQLFFLSTKGKTAYGLSRRQLFVFRGGVLRTTQRVLRTLQGPPVYHSHDRSGTLAQFILVGSHYAL